MFSNLQRKLCSSSYSLPAPKTPADLVFVISEMQVSLQFFIYCKQNAFLSGCLQDRSDEVLGKILETF